MLDLIPSLILALLLAMPFSAQSAAPRWIGAARPPTEVKRVVTLAPSLTETVVALGRQQALVGVSRYDDVPAAEGLPRVGAADGVSLEALVALRPEVVMAQPTAGNVRNFQTLASLGIPVLVLPTETLEETEASLAAAGRVMGRAEQGRGLAKTLRDTRARIRARAARRSSPRVLLVVGFDPLVVAGPGSYLDALLRDAGGVNAAADAGGAWSVYPLERAAAARPEVILDASGVKRGRAIFAQLPTLDSARWVEPPSNAMLRPGPSLARGLEELAVLLHGPEILEPDAAVPKDASPRAPSPVAPSRSPSPSRSPPPSRSPSPSPSPSPP